MTEGSPEAVSEPVASAVDNGEGDDRGIPFDQAHHEFERQERLINQTTDMHAMLRDRYTRWNKAIMITLLIASVLAATLSFSSAASLVVAGLEIASFVVLGAYSIGVVLIALIGQVFDLSGRAAVHSDAVRQLSGLRAEYRRPLPSGGEAEHFEVLSRLYGVVMDSRPSISSRQFNRLKAKHLEKLEVSKYLSAHPGTSYRAARRAVSERDGA